MTTDRKKAILYLSITFIIGLLIGALIPGFFGRMRYHEWRGREGEKDTQEMVSRHDMFARMITKIVQSDSVQAKEIKPFIEKAAVKMDSLGKDSNKRMSAIMDSLKIDLKPLLNEEQFKKLAEFTGKAHDRWRGRRGRN